jgi:hypothetical protein
MEREQPAKSEIVAQAIGFASIILVLALLGGGGLLFYDYFRQHTAQRSWQRERSAERVEQDTPVAMKHRFLTGAGVGAFGGVIYMIQCIRRRENL